MEQIKVRDYMRHSIPAIRCGTPLSEVVDILLLHRIHGTAVVNVREEVVGFVSEQDCLQKLLVGVYHCEADSLVDDVMRKEVLSVQPDDSIIELAQSMGSLKPKVYPVIENGRLVGEITRSDVLRALREIRSHGCSA